MIDLSQYLIQVILDTISGILKNLFWVILIIWGVKTLASSIVKGFKSLIPEIPKWIDKYMKWKREQNAIIYARGIRNGK